ncbi:hypothetical protein [Mucilaginibacter sp. SP1R1]|uniref:hypothetical protein n=1 Tax=Mucilaginibacter sp. SP1R1 TaxID=2723091 RepID=UPI00162288AA|nr:hypothetical protein [Mucilaginibacter sp. SP1R1]MBB6149500.1 hypothetical protein [Mucilaginibacter sp. SP1R1]
MKRLTVFAGFIMFLSDGRSAAPIIHDTVTIDTVYLQAEKLNNSISKLDTSLIKLNNAIKKKP